MRGIDAKALIQLKATRHRLQAQTYRNMRGKVMAGDPDAAMKGLRKLLTMEGERK